jgi:hypothetical protein
MNTLLCIKMFKLHPYMFRTVNWFIFRESHSFTSLVIILLDVCVICEIVTRPEDEPIKGSKHVGV